MNPIYIILGITALVYAPTIFGLLKLDYRIVSVLPTKIEENKITFNAGMELTNNSSFRLMINDLNCDVWLNGTMIGTISNVFNTPIPAHRKQVLGLLIEITPNNLGAELWQSAINQNLQNFVLVLKGTITANNKTLPLNAQWTINDFVSGIGAIGELSESVQKKFNHYFNDSEFELVEPFGSLWNSRGKKLYIKSKGSYKAAMQYLERQKFIERVYEGGGDNVICVILK